MKRVELVRIILDRVEAARVRVSDVFDARIVGVYTLLCEALEATVLLKREYEDDRLVADKAIAAMPPVEGRDFIGTWSTAGLVTCGHWTCPSCGPYRARNVAGTIGAAMRRWLDVGDGHVLGPRADEDQRDVWMLSLTVPHYRTIRIKLVPADPATPGPAPAKPYRGAGGYLFALDQVRNGQHELGKVIDKGTKASPSEVSGCVSVAYAYLVDAERALDDAITESPPPPETHGERRRR